MAQLVRAYQVRGHLLADLDPLGISRHGVDHGLVGEDVSVYFNMTFMLI